MVNLIQVCLSSRNLIDQKFIQNSKTFEIIEELQKTKFIGLVLTKDMAENIQPFSS